MIEKSLPHIPEEIQELLKNAKSIDDLLVSVTQETIELLENWQALIPLLKGKELQKRLSKLSIQTYKNTAPSDHIPFDVHPILVLRKYYRNELEEGNFSLSSKIRKNKQAQKGLRVNHYNYQTYLEKYNIDSTAPSVKKKLIGEMNRLLTQDVLLWKIAKEYIQNTSPTYQGFIGKGKDKNEWNVSNLRKTEINKIVDVKGYGNVVLKIKFHQLDDFLLVESMPVIILAIRQALMRFENPQPNKDTANMLITKSKQGYEIAYDEVFKEIQRVFNDSVHWAWYLLNWEAKIINSMTDDERTELENNKLAEGKKAHINFWEVGQYAGLADSSKLRDLRNTAFHTKIPDGWAYWQKEQDEDLCNLIGYTKKMKTNYEIRN